MRSGSTRLMIRGTCAWRDGTHGALETWWTPPSDMPRPLGTAVHSLPRVTGADSSSLVWSGLVGGSASPLDSCPADLPVGGAALSVADDRRTEGDAVCDVGERRRIGQQVEGCSTVVRLERCADHGRAVDPVAGGDVGKEASSGQRVTRRGTDGPAVVEHESDHAMGSRHAHIPNAYHGGRNAPAIHIDRPDAHPDPDVLDRDVAIGRRDAGATGQADGAHRFTGGRLLVDRDRAQPIDRPRRPTTLTLARRRHAEVVESIAPIADRIELDRVQLLPYAVDR